MDTNISCSFDPTSNAYIKKTIGLDANNNKSGANSWAGGKPAFAYINFEDVGASARNRSKTIYFFTSTIF